jgi:hypothetical protein
MAMTGIRTFAATLLTALCCMSWPSSSISQVQQIPPNTGGNQIPPNTGGNQINRVDPAASYDGINDSVAPPPRPSAVTACYQRYESELDRIGLTWGATQMWGTWYCDVKYYDEKGEVQILRCEGTECHNPHSSPCNLDFIPNEGGCSVQPTFGYSDCWFRARELDKDPDKNRQKTFRINFNCPKLTAAQCDDFFRLLICEEGARERMEELGMLNPDGSLNQEKCDELRRRYL